MAWEPPTKPTATLQDCKDWRDTLAAMWASGGDESFDRGLQLEEDLYFQRFKVRVPEGMPGVKSGSAPADANAAIDSLTPKDIQVHVRPARRRQKYHKQADTLTRFAHGMLHSWRRPRDIYRLLSFDQVVRRVAIVRVLFDDTIWAPRPEAHTPQTWDDESDEHFKEEPSDVMVWSVRNRRKNPIIMERRDPRNTRWFQAEDGTLLAVVESYDLTVMEAKRTLSNELWKTQLDMATRGMKLTDKVRLDDIWVGPDRCLLLEDRPLYPGRGNHQGVLPHGYPEIPYVIAPYREIGFDEPGRRYRGMLSDVMGLYEIESQVLSMHISQLGWNAWRTFMGWLGHDVTSVVIKPGEFVRVDRSKGHWLEMMQGEPVPPELAQTIGMMDAYLQRNSVAGGPRGGSEGTRSAQQVYAIQSQRQLKLDPGKDSLVALTEGCLRLATMHVENCLDEPLVLPLPGRDREGEPRGEVTIRPTDIQGYYDGYEINFGRRLDPAILEQAKTLQTFALNNWMPMSESWRLSGLTDNPQEWEDLLLQQNIDRLPFIVELAALKMAKAFFGTDSPEYLRLIEQMEQQERGAGAAPAPGAPGMPSGGGMQPTASMPRGDVSPNGAGSEMAGTMQPGHRQNAGRPVGGRTPPDVAGGTGPRNSRGPVGY